MAKKNSKKGSGGRSLAGTLLGILILVGAVVLSELTGIDIVALINNTADVVEDTLPVEEAPPRPDTLPEAETSADVVALNVGLGSGAQKGFWTLYFNAPTGDSDTSGYVNGIDVPVAERIDATERTLDIAAYEFDNEVLTEAVLRAHERGVQVRIVTDDEAGLEEEDESIPIFIEAGIPVVDDDRSALMHNKFIIFDSVDVLTGSWNLTRNGTYRNNNNAVILRSQRAVQAYQREFEEMFGGSFGPRSSSQSAQYTQNGIPVEIYFAPEDDVIGAIINQINAADTHIRFMAFSFTQDDIGAAILERAADGVEVSGIFEVRGSETEFSELTALYCAGLGVRQDGNPYALHHKVIIIDDETVLTGSFNFSANATESNDENLLIMQDPDFAALFLEEFNSRFAESRVPDPGDLDCG